MGRVREKARSERKRAVRMSLGHLGHLLDTRLILSNKRITGTRSNGLPCIASGLHSVSRLSPPPPSLCPRGRRRRKPGCLDRSRPPCTVTEKGLRQKGLRVAVPFRCTTTASLPGRRANGWQHAPRPGMAHVQRAPGRSAGMPRLTRQVVACGSVHAQCSRSAHGTRRKLGGGGVRRC
jgi:hypothetical protein